MAPFIIGWIFLAAAYVYRWPLTAVALFLELTGTAHDVWVMAWCFEMMMWMATTSDGQRVDALEAEVATLKKKLKRQAD